MHFRTVPRQLRQSPGYHQWAQQGGLAGRARGVLLHRLAYIPRVKRCIKQRNNYTYPTPGPPPPWGLKYALSDIELQGMMNLHREGLMEVHVADITAASRRVCQANLSIEVGTY